MFGCAKHVCACNSHKQVHTYPNAYKLLGPGHEAQAQEQRLYLHEGSGKHVEGSTGLHQCIMCRKCLKLVWCSDEREACGICNGGCNAFSKARRCIQACANSRSALSKAVQARQHVADTCHTILNLPMHFYQIQGQLEDMVVELCDTCM